MMRRSGSSGKGGRQFVSEFAEKVREGAKDGGDWADTLGKQGVKLKDGKKGVRTYSNVLEDVLRASDKIKSLEGKRSSLKEALANYDAFRDDRRWNPHWLPVFANGGGDFLAVTCSEEPDSRGEVIHFRIDESVHPVEFVSVSRMLDTVAMTRGAVRTLVRRPGGSPSNVTPGGNTPGESSRRCATAIAAARRYACSCRSMTCRSSRSAVRTSSRRSWGFAAGRTCSPTRRRKHFPSNPRPFSATRPKSTPPTGRKPRAPKNTTERPRWRQGNFLSDPHPFFAHPDLSAVAGNANHPVGNHGILRPRAGRPLATPNPRNFASPALCRIS